MELIREREKERSQCSFPIRELTYFLDGSKEETVIAESIMKNFERDPVFKIKDFNLNLNEKRELTFKRITKILPYSLNDDYLVFLKRIQILGIFDGATLTRFGVHYGLFLQTLKTLGTDEQFNHWANLKGGSNLNKFYGCFGMTELGHGSNVAKLQTESTFDPSTDGFYINTPHLNATKWWIGGAAHSATHCVVYARLISNGKDYGIKNFIVQLRDFNGELLPGIAIGDIGKKMGRDGVDNGWIQFSNCWIPRFNMLSKFTQINSKGEVTLPKFEQLSYTALVNGRVSMVSDSFQVGKKFITIALRYATIRRQFGNINGLEQKIIDYSHHRRRLFPLLASIFAINSSSIEVLKFNQYCSDLISNNELNEAIPNLKDLFILSGGLKAFATWEVCKIIDESRQACGGHGYSAYNEFGKGYDDWVVQCTWEGDNNVLTLTCGRSMISQYLEFEKTGKIGNYSKYLADKDQKLNIDLNNIESIINHWEILSRKLIISTTNKFKILLKSNDKESSFEKISRNRFEITKIHTNLIILKSFNDRIKQSNPEIKSILNLLLLLFSYSKTVENLSLFYSFEIFENGIYQQLNELIDETNEKLRPEIIGLTDSFNLSDFFIGAKIGNYNGNLYENYFEFVNNENPTSYKPHYFDNVLKPFLHREI